MAEDALQTANMHLYGFLSRRLTRVFCLHRQFLRLARASYALAAYFNSSLINKTKVKVSVKLRNACFRELIDDRLDDGSIFGALLVGQRHERVHELDGQSAASREDRDHLVAMIHADGH